MADLSFLEKFTKGNSAKMKRYISMYLQIAPEIFVRMKANVQEKNWEDLAINAHSLKPQAEYMGLVALKRVLIEIENKVKKNSASGLSQLYEQALTLHLQGERALKEALGKL